MPEQDISFPWSIELVSGWVMEARVDDDIDDHIEFMAIVPGNNDALLRITTFDPEVSGIDAAYWVETTAQINRAKGRPVSAMTCGEFCGYVYEFATSEERLRGWTLRCGSFPLDVNYRCELAHAGRDDSLVDSMLNTLRLNHHGIL